MTGTKKSLPLGVLVRTVLRAVINAREKAELHADGAADDELSAPCGIRVMLGAIVYRVRVDVDM